MIGGGLGSSCGVYHQLLHYQKRNNRDNNTAGGGEQDE
jgi:hypothetical protein